MKPDRLPGPGTFGQPGPAPGPPGSAQAPFPPSPLDRGEPPPWDPGQGAQGSGFGEQQPSPLANSGGAFSDPLGLPTRSSSGGNALPGTSGPPMRAGTGEDALASPSGPAVPPAGPPVPPGMRGDAAPEPGAPELDPYRDLWRPRSERPAYPPPGFADRPAGEDAGPADYGTAPGGYFGPGDPFRSAASVTAGPEGPGSTDQTSALEVPPLDAEEHGMFQPPPAAGSLGASHLGEYPGDFPMEHYLRPPLQQPEPSRRPRFSRKALVIGGAAVVALIVAAGAAFALTRSAPPPQPVAKPTPAATPQLTNINSVRTDPKPITGAEIFPHSRVTQDGLRFTKVAQAVNNDCGLTARGSFAHALKAERCERVVRATYVDSHKRFAVTAGVAALPAKQAAERADHKENFRTGAWFTGLNGRRGSGAQNLSRAAGYAYDVVEGRYIIYAFATGANGKSIAGKDGRLLDSISRSFAMMVRQPINARATHG